MKHKIQKALLAEMLNRLPQRLNSRNDFPTSPIEVNAFYSPDTNAVFMLPPFMQGVFFDREWPRSVNYGMLGYFVGHELTHGYDNQGANYDKVGNYRNWWDPSTYKTFVARKQCMVDQYSRFAIPELPGKNVDGAHTQGEDIADNGGLKESFQAYREHVRKRGQEEAPLPGLEKYAQNQIFFIAFSRTYCAVLGPEAAEETSKDEHAPERFRALGPLMNSQDFARAFNCPVGSPMNPANKCAVW